MCATILGWRCRVKMPFLLPWTRVTPCAVMKSAKFHRCSPMKKRAARSRSNVPKYCVGVKIGVRVRVRARAKVGTSAWVGPRAGSRARLRGWVYGWVSGQG